MNAEAKDTAKDPSLVFKINSQNYLSDDALAGAGLQLLAQLGSNATIALSVDPNLTNVRQKVGQYTGPIPLDQKNPPHNGLFAAIDSFAGVSAEDRLGSALSAHGFTRPELIPDESIFLLDVELWDMNDAVLRDIYVDRVARKIEEFEGELLSRYFGAGLFIVRVRISGAGLKALLEMSEVSWIDLPPVPDFGLQPEAEFTIAQLPPMAAPPSGSVCIGIIDSGITESHPMFAGVVSGSFGVPSSLGKDDEKGHGTSVASLAAYGPLFSHLGQPQLAPRFQIASAKVVNSQGHFDDDRALPDIMEEAIRTLNSEYNCRVINISLADIEHRVGGRPSNWAMTLDNLARELGLIITLSAGNVGPISARISAEGLGIYPSYLLEESSRMFEPASSMNSLVIGSLSHSNGLMPGDEDYVDIVAITDKHLPSPFSRTGPGYSGSIKPDLAEYGGTAIWHGSINRLTSDRPSCGVLALNSNYLQSLMVYRFGTSFAAPLAAFKVAALLEEFPHSSANYIRALMGLGAYHPPELTASVAATNERHAYRFAGYGVADVDLALASEDSRVVMAVEDSLPIDSFAVYEIPIPSDYQTVQGRRHIRISLAFDPPVRNSRKEYRGIKMGYHLVRGKSAEEVFERFRSWGKEEKEENGGAFTFEGQSWNCKMIPLATHQEAGTLQVGTFVQKKNTTRYGDTYYLVVRCEGKWAAKLITAQTYAVAVELFHEAQLDLYQQVAVTLQA